MCALVYSGKILLRHKVSRRHVQRTTTRKFATASGTPFELRSGAQNLTSDSLIKGGITPSALGRVNHPRAQRERNASATRARALSRFSFGYRPRTTLADEWRGRGVLVHARAHKQEGEGERGALARAMSKSLANVLLEQPMERHAMVAGLAPSRVRIMQREEQADSYFFGDEQSASSTANSSQSLSRSCQGLAPQSGVQAPLDLDPAKVVRWSDFYTEVGWDSFSGAVGFGDVQVMARDFRTRASTESIVNEATAFLRFSGRFIDPLKEIVLDKEAETAINSFTPMDITQEVELAPIGHRVDLAWTRKVNSDDDRNNAGILTPDDKSRARFLVHEHKSPGKFPYGLAANDFDKIAEAFMQNSSSSLDEAKETVNGAWELACDDMVDYWDLGASLTERESVMRFRYPIIQLYVTMLRSFCKYGVLSTTDRTWFFKLDEDNVLHVSDVFHSTGTGRESMRHAYACMLHRAATGSARLTLTDDHSQAIAQTNIRIGSPEWTKMWRQFGWDGSGTGATASGGHPGANGALPADMEAMREMLPLKSDLQFPYAGGLLDVITRYPEGRYGFSIRVDTGGVDTVVKVMTPSKDPHVESVFWHEMDVYLALRSLWGTHVPWYLYGGRHIFNDLIIATIYAGESLDASALSDDVREKAWAALMALHEVGVAHRNVQLQNFIMDDTGAVRIINFAHAEMNASNQHYRKDCEAFDRIFFRSDT